MQWSWKLQGGSKWENIQFFFLARNVKMMDTHCILPTSWSTQKSHNQAGVGWRLSPAFLWSQRTTRKFDFYKKENWWGRSWEGLYTKDLHLIFLNFCMANEKLAWKDSFKTHRKSKPGLGWSVLSHLPMLLGISVSSLCFRSSIITLALLCPKHDLISCLTPYAKHPGSQKAPALIFTVLGHRTRKGQGAFKQLWWKRRHKGVTRREMMSEAREMDKWSLIAWLFL